MSPQPQIESESMQTALRHNDTGCNPSIIPRESMHKHNIGQTLKLNIRSRSSKYN